MVIHIGGTYSHSGMMDYPGLTIAEMHLGQFPNFKAGKSTSGQRFVQEQLILRSQCTGSEKLRLQNQLTNL